MFHIEVFILIVVFMHMLTFFFSLTYLEKVSLFIEMAQTIKVIHVAVNWFIAKNRGIKPTLRSRKHLFSSLNVLTNHFV